MNAANNSRERQRTTANGQKNQSARSLANLVTFFMKNSRSDEELQSVKSKAATLIPTPRKGCPMAFIDKSHGKGDKHLKETNES